MSSISEMWTKNPAIFDLKTLSQILAFAGDGKLKDNNETSIEFRELLDKVSSTDLKKFADNCLKEKFDDSGFALQDIINQIGTRLGFSVNHGLYRGKQNDIGYDGIWLIESHNIVLEVKTTDAYRINLDTIATYRNKLIEQSRISKINSSILIVVSRDDTGDLEAQIRGSQHAWNVRLISTDSLFRLLDLKENFNDSKTIQQINELLKPKEYTRVDKLIELIFLTSKDLQLEIPIDAMDENPEERKGGKEEKIKSGILKVPNEKVREDCIKKIQSAFEINLIKQTRSSYSDKSKSIGITCAVSKKYVQGQNENFWFGFLPHQQDFLKDFKNAYVAFGCGASDNIILIPYKDFEPLIKNLSITKSEDRIYWHIVINYRDSKYYLSQPQKERGNSIDISKYKM